MKKTPYKLTYKEYVLLLDSMSCYYWKHDANPDAEMKKELQSELNMLSSKIAQLADSVQEAE